MPWCFSPYASSCTSSGNSHPRTAKVYRFPPVASVPWRKVSLWSRGPVKHTWWDWHVLTTSPAPEQFDEAISPSLVLFSVLSGVKGSEIKSSPRKCCLKMKWRSVSAWRNCRSPAPQGLMAICGAWGAETYASKQVFPPTYQEACGAECVLQRWSCPLSPACGRGNFYPCAVSSWSFPGAVSKIIMPLCEIMTCSFWKYSKSWEQETHY